jgi:capsular polysaccharide biosynthesis protein
MKIRELLEIAQRQRVAIVAVLIVGLAAYIVALPHFKKYTATSTLLAASASSQDSSVLDPTKDPAASAVGLGDLENLATSASVLDNVERDLHLPANEAIRFGSEVKAKAVFGSDVLPVSVTDRDPDLAVSEVNSLATELSAYARNISTSRYDELIRDLRAQVAQRAAALRSIDARVQTLTGANYFVTMDQGTAAINARLIALAAQEQQLQATVDGDIAGARMAAERPDLSRRLAGHEITAQDPAIVALQTQFGKDLAALDNMRAGYTDRYAGVANLEETVSRERASMSRAEADATRDPTQSASYVAAMLDANKAAATLATDRAQLATVHAQLATLDDRLGSSAGAGAQINELRRLRLADEDAFAQLSARLARAIADRSQAASIGSVIVIDRATSASPALLGRPGVLGVAFAFAFVWLAFTLAFILDSTGTRLRTTASIEDLYGTPVFTPVG